MKLNKVIASVFSLLGFSIVLLTLVVDRKESRKMEIESSKYYNLEIAGRVQSANQNRGTIRLHLKNQPHITYYLNATSNNSLSPSYLSEFLRSNDSIYKPKNSMELFVHRGGMKYRFVIGKSLK